MDFLKGIGCAGVVFIHIPFPGRLGLIIKSLASFAVPVFLMISGYYAGKGYKNVSKLVKFTLSAILLYFLYTLLKAIIIGSPLEITIGWLLRFIILNDCDFINAGHLWYLPSIIYCYILLYFSEKHGLLRCCYISIPIILCFKVLFLSLPEVNWHMRGNWLVGAFPYYMLGHFFSKEKFEKNMNQIKNSSILLCGFVGMIMCSIYIQSIIAAIGTIILSVALFLFALNNKVSGSEKIAYIGKNYSGTIYITHILIAEVMGIGISFIDKICDVNITNDSWYLLIRPLLVLFVSVIVALIWNNVKSIRNRVLF